MSKEKKEKKKKSLARRIIEWTLLVVFGGIFVVMMAGQVEGMIKQKENYNQILRFGWGSFVVQTDSMEPVYPVKSAVITYKQNAADIYEEFSKTKTLEEDIAGMEISHPIDITFFNINPGFRVQPTNKRYNDPIFITLPEKTMTHRLVEMQVDMSVPYGQGRYVFITRGINTGGNASLEGQYQYFCEAQLLGRVQFGSKALGWFFTALSSPWGLLIFLLIPAFYLVIVSVNDIFKALKDPSESTSSDGTAALTGADLTGLSDKDKERLKQELLQQMIEEKAAKKAAKPKQTEPNPKVAEIETPKNETSIPPVKEEKETPESKTEENIAEENEVESKEETKPNPSEKEGVSEKKEEQE